MSERFGYSDEDWAQIADPSTICDRLRGQYNVPVSDGAGPLNGSTVFNRYFQTTPIQNAAADLIEQLQVQIASLNAESERLRSIVVYAYAEGFKDAWAIAHENLNQVAEHDICWLQSTTRAALQPKEGNQ